MEDSVRRTVRCTRRAWHVRGVVCQRVWCMMLMALTCVERPSFADLLPHEVVVVWNSRDATSTAVRDAYVAARPGVNSFDINRAYAIPPDLNNPPSLAMTATLITPNAFESWIRLPLLNFIESQAPDTLCFVTTRGVPALITEDFSPGAGHGTENGVFASMESALTVIGIESFRPGFFSGARINPYFGAIDTSFRSFVDDNCLRGRFFMATRLDASAGPGATATNEVFDLIDRSTALTVNKFGVNIVVDDVAGGCGIMAPSREAAQRMRNAGWLVWYDGSSAFLHGPSVEFAPDPDCPCPQNCQLLDFESLYNDYPDMTHAGMGTNHEVLCSDGEERECVSSTYVQDFAADTAGVFASLESFNGLTLWGGSTVGQGNGLDWLSYAGGSFALLHGYGHFSGDAPQLDFAMLNLYEHRLSWAEAAMSSSVKVGFVTVPIGDPLATVNVINPDVVTDGTIDINDLEAIFDALSNPVDNVVADRMDLDDDGAVTLDDAVFVLDVFGRTRPTDATNPISVGTLKGFIAEPCTLYTFTELPLLSNGDVNGDLVVDEEDVALLEQVLPCQCLQLDVNNDGVIDEADIAIADDAGDPLDVNNDGAVTCLDLYEVLDNQCNGNCGDTPYDLNGDTVVNTADVTILADLLVDTSGIGSVLELDMNCDSQFNCEDVAVIRANATANIDPPGVPVAGCANDQYDINDDGVVDCTDEWIAEWLLIINNVIDSCEDVGLGCGQCP